MDINSLLSPQESPVRSSNNYPQANTPPQTNAAPSSPMRRPGAARPGSGKRTSSSLSQEITLNSPPQDLQPRSHPNLGYDTIAQAQQLVFNPAYNTAYEVQTPQNFIMTPGSDGRSPFGTPQQQTHRPSLQYAGGRNISNPQMDTLADLATIQLSHISRHNSYADPHRSPPIAGPAGRMGVHRTLSNVSSSDLAMAEAPSQTPPPRVVTAPSVSDADQKLINELENYLEQNSYAYDSHVQLINLLHQGFVAHVYDAAGNAVKDPRDYRLLSDLRQAREAMDSRFAVGEDIWREWIHDESLLAHTGEERLAVMELCQKAVSEEPSSVVLWLLYGEYVFQSFNVGSGQVADNSGRLTEEDRQICQAVFTREFVLGVWEKAVQATEWRIDESNHVWDRYVDWILAEFPERPTPGQVDQVNNMFMARLQVPHATWSETSSKFWPIVSKYNANTWEEIMAAMNEMAEPAKRQYGLREVHELNIRRASDSGDKTALYNAFTEYLAWDVKNARKGRVATFNTQLRSSLFERALLRFPTVVEWWLDYADFLTTANADSPNILAALERATRHCPWSGDLWSRRILRSDVEKRPYEEVGNVKHKATNSGLLHIGGMEEVLKVYSAWCGYLRRRAFDPENTDDEVDMAEMGITGTVEDAQVAGKKIYGEEFKGDPLFRLETIHIKFLTEAHRFDDARSVWERLIPTHAQYFDFWYRHYRWELLIWAHARMSESVRLETLENAPQQASAILRQALKQRDLDWPEKLIETYTHHFQQHESAEAVQTAEVEIRVASHYLQIRRAKEAEEAAAASADAAAAPATTNTEIPHRAGLETIQEEAPASGKRKRDDETQQNGDDGVKRNKTDDVKPTTEASSSASAQIKRDREHNTITVRDLPKDAAEKRIRQFFSDCGDVLSVNIASDDGAMNSYATIEFGDNEGALAAKTRDGKEIDGQVIRIQSGTLSTLYVTNYPPDFDEAKITELFQDFGTITSVRFPSLKYNQRRRFCYVQFLTTDEARAATSLNNKVIDKQHRLVAVISDPNAKKNRIGAASEGRELHVANVDFNATDEDIKELFSEHGTVERVRRLRGTNGKFTGTCFVILSKPEEATAAVALNNKPLLSRLLRVTLSTDKSAAAKAGGTTVVREGSTAEPEDLQSPGGEANGRRGSVASIGATGGELNADTARTKHERTIALLNLPDTVNDARIQSLLSHYGPLRKIVMKRDRAAAMAEFVNLQDAGKVSLGIDCSALGPNVRIGEPSEIFAKDKRPANAAAVAASVPKIAGAPVMRPAQASVSRPGQSGRRGGRGGLGFKRGGGFGASRSAEDADKMDEGADGGAKKGNADFRALFEKSRDDAAARPNNISAAKPTDGEGKGEGA